MAKKRRKGEYGKGTVYYREDRASWSISYRVDGKRKSESGFESEKDAKAALAVHLGDLASGAEKVGQLKTKGTLNTFAARWLTDRKLTHRSAYDDANRWANHFESRRRWGRCAPTT